MKKFFYTLALLSMLSLTISACTKEEVKPQGGNSTGGSGSERGF
jgi:hypothetical protein